MGGRGARDHIYLSLSLSLSICQSAAYVPSYHLSIWNLSIYLCLYACACASVQDVLLLRSQATEKSDVGMLVF